MPIGPLAPCDNDATSFEDIQGMLCDMYLTNSTSFSSLNTGLSALFDNVSAVYSKLVDVQDALNGLRDWVGDPSGGPTLYAKLGSVATQVDEVDGDLDEVISNLGTRVGSQQSVVDAVYRESASMSVADMTYDVKTALGTPASPLASILGSLSMAIFGGGVELVSLAAIIGNVWNAPPADTLAAGSWGSLSATTHLDIPSGVYGVELQMIVPGWYGKLCDDPIVYVPEVAVAQWWSDFGSVAPAMLIQSNSIRLFPIPAGSHNLHIKLRAGVSCNFRWLKWLG